MSANEIGDYALIGDGRSAALVSRAGAIDWLCWPRFDSPSLFAALLDPAAGRWSVAPTAAYSVERAYLPATNVLRTRFVTDGGAVELTDFMTVASEADKRRIPVADHELIRLVDCVAGEVEVEMLFAPRPNYGGPARLRDQRALGVRFDVDGGTCTLRTDAPLTLGDDAARARVTLRAGDSLHASLSFSSDGPAVLPPVGLWSRQTLQRSADWWRGWAARTSYHGPFTDAVTRSVLALKLLGYAPSGAVIAAPTTSLPEALGGTLNWDYRYCWLRDASLTVRALLGVGYHDEAEAFVSWLLHSTRITRPALNILYDVFGNVPPAERTLAALHGFAGSRPVRIGNAAVDQLQLDVYGEVIDAAAQLVRGGGRLDGDAQRMLVSFGEFVCRHWREPDEGIWEPRSGRRNHTHSRLLCWTALDRLVELHDRGLVRRAPAERFAAERVAIRADLEARAWNPRLGSWVATLDGDDMDATLLLLAWYGFEDAASPRMRATAARIRRELGSGDVLLYRYRNGDSPNEGAFGICSFWWVEYLALAGEVDEAERALAELLRYGNDVGLFAEEIDPANGAQLGNFPQGFSHVGLLNAALTVARAAGRRVTTAEARP